VGSAFAVGWNFAARLDHELTAIPKLRRRLWQELPIRRGREEVTLIVSELATNAILHGASPVYVQVNIADQIARVEVEDAFPGWCKPAEDSRGMVVVDGLSSCWGVNSDDGLGKVVWAEIPVG
jgi:anti-sigma regulatory factor (Ser/Thr protein kinase)